MDLVCFDDLDPFASETDDEGAQLEQDLYHRLLEEYGSNPDDEDRGADLLGRLSGTDPPETIARLIEADWSKDERVLLCEVTVTVPTQASNDGVVATVGAVVTTSDASLKLGYSVASDGTVTGGIVS